VPHDASAQFTAQGLLRSALIHLAARPYFVEQVYG
jgi:hypothetical protein